MRGCALNKSLIVIASLALGSLLSTTPALAQIPPLAIDDQYTTGEDQTLTRNANNGNNGVRANDIDLDDPRNDLDVVWTPPHGMPSNGTLTPNPNNNGGFIYVPNANFNGIDTFTYQLRDPDGNLSNVATVTITVNPVNDAPTGVVDRSYSTDENVPLAVAAPGVLAGVTDVDGDSVSAVLVTNVSGAAGTVSLSANGAFSYSPAAGFFGTATFTYRAVDNAVPPAQSNTATVTITVRAVNDPPVANADTYAATEDTVLTRAQPGVLGNDTDPDKDALTAVLVASPTHGTVTLNANGSFTYAPAADYNGPDSFTYRARDNGSPPLQSTAATVTLNIASVNDAPRFAPGVTALPSQTATESVALTPIALAPFFVDPEGSPLTFTVTGLPPGLTATPDGAISGTPANPSAGTYTVSVAVSDGQRQFSTTFNLLVLEGARTDVALSATATPSPAVINQAVTWTFAIENRSPEEHVANLALQIQFSGPATFALNPAPNCVTTPQSTGVTVACTAGPVAPSGQTSVAITGSSAQPGDVIATATVTITDSLPIDATPDNDTATVVVNIAQTLAAGPAQTLPAVGYRASAAGDFDRDGFIDLAVATESAGTLIHPNVADTSTPGSAKRVLAAQALPLGDSGSGTDIAAADFDGDGALDLVVGKAPGPAVVLRNPNDGTFGFVPVPNAVGTKPDATHSVAAGDLDQDGRVDIVLGNNGANRVFMNQGGWTFAEAHALGNDDSRDAALVNLTGDNALELVFANANREAAVYTFDSATGRYQERRLTSTTSRATSVAAADFDANGRVDLVFGRSQSKAVLFNVTPPGGTLQFATPVELGAAPTADVLATDTDADGNADIVGINSSGSHQIFANNGAGQFTLRAQQFASAGARHGTAAKLSADDRVDVAVVGTSTLEVFYNDGAGDLGRGDTGAPTIQLLGQASVELTVESPYTDAGATASDSVDGDLTNRLRVDNPVNPAVVGTYTITYNVVDNSGNAAVPATRTVKVGVRSGTGGGGGGSFDLVALLALAIMALLGRLRHPTIRRSFA